MNTERVLSRGFGGINDIKVDNIDGKRKTFAPIGFDPNGEFNLNKIEEWVQAAPTMTSMLNVKLLGPGTNWGDWLFATRRAFVQAEWWRFSCKFNK